MAWLFIVLGATTFSQVLSFSGATSGLVAMVQDASLPGAGPLCPLRAILALACARRAPYRHGP